MAGIQLKVTPDTLKSKAQEVQSQIKSFETQWKQLQDIVTKTKGYWVGEASDLHQKQFKDYKEDVDKILKRLNEHPVDLMKMANVYDEGEAAAIAIAQSLPEDVII